MNTEPFDRLANKLFEALPSGVKDIEKDLQSKFHEILQTAFQKMDLITREEFDTQTKVLSKTREKVEVLQAQIEVLLAKQSGR